MAVAAGVESYHLLKPEHVNQFNVGLTHMKIRHVRGPVRAPFFNGKMERAFRTFRIWWRMVLVAACGRGMQRRIDSYRHWYNTHRSLLTDLIEL